MSTKQQRRGHVRQRGETYTAYWRARDDDGQSKQRSKGGFTTAKAAEQHLTKTLHQLDTGAYVEPDRRARRQTFKQFVHDTWLPAVRGSVRATTYASYESNLTLHVIPSLGSLRLLEITPDRLNKLYSDLLLNGRVNGKQDGLSTRTVRYCHVILRRVLADAVRWDRIARNPAERADPPKVKRHEMRTWSPIQLRAFLNSVRDDRLYAAYLLFATTGARRGEVFGLRWQDVDLEAGKLQIRQALGANRTFEPPKTDKGRRRIGLDPQTVVTLRSHRARQAEERLAAGSAWTESDLVFTREDGTTVRPESVSKAFKRLAKAADLPEIRLHDLRHSYASAALEAGVPTKIVSERLGHSSIAITGDIYQHVLPELDDQAAAQVAAVILG